MKKSLLIAITIALLSISVFGANQLINNISERSMDESVLREQDEKYVYFVDALNPANDEKAYIDRLISSGYDVNAVIDIYEFWLDTSEDIEIIEKVYAYLPEDKETKYWIDDAFIDLSNKGETLYLFSDLTYEQGKAYIDSGISLTDMSIADVMSRKGIKNLEEIIESRMENASWYEIADEIYDFSSEQGYDEHNRDVYNSIDDGFEIINSIKKARLTGDSVLSCLSDAIEERAASESVEERDIPVDDEQLQF